MREFPGSRWLGHRILSCQGTEFNSSAPGRGTKIPQAMRYSQKKVMYVFLSEKVVAPHSSIVAWKIPWMEEPGRLQSMGSRRVRHLLSDFTLTYRFPALEKEMATHSNVLAWRIPGTGEPGGLPSMGSHRVRHDWNNLAAAACISLTVLRFPFSSVFSSYIYYHVPRYSFLLIYHAWSSQVFLNFWLDVLHGFRKFQPISFLSSFLFV